MSKRERKGLLQPIRNFVAKYAKTSGAGVHKAKYGRFVSRARQKAIETRNNQNEV